MFEPDHEFGTGGSDEEKLFKAEQSYRIKQNNRTGRIKLPCICKGALLFAVKTPPARESDEQLFTLSPVFVASTTSVRYSVVYAALLYISVY